MKSYSMFVSAVFAMVMLATAVAASAEELSRIKTKDAVSFRVERDGEPLGLFTEVSGIGSEHEVIEIRDGSDPNVVRKIPGPLRFSNLTLKRGVTSNLDLWNWRKEVVEGSFTRSQVSITMLSHEGTPVALWHFENAWPSKIVGPTPKSDDNDVGIEELTIVHEGFYREL